MNKNNKNIVSIEKGSLNILSIGSKIGNYVITKILNKHQRSTLYLATRIDNATTKNFVIKIENTVTDDRRSNNTEAQILFNLSGGNENICTVYDAGIMPTGQKYIVIEYIDGLTLDLYFKKNNTKTLDILRFFITICETFGYIHQHNIIHGDIKPENILINKKGEVKVINFEKNNLLHSNDKYISTYSDIYSIGIMLNSILREQLPPYTNPNFFNYLFTQNHKGLPFKYYIFSNEINDIIKGCLSNTSKGRYNTSYEISLDIKRFISLENIRSTKTSALKTLLKSVIRYKKHYFFALIFVLGVTVNGIWLSLQKIQLIEHKKELAAQSLTLINEKKTSESLLTQTQEILTYVDPRVRLGDEINVRSLLEKSESKLINNKNMPNVIKAKMFITLGNSYFGLTEYSKSEHLYKKAFDLYFVNLDNLNKDRIDVLVKITNALNMQNKYDQTLKISEVTLDEIISTGFKYSEEVELLFNFNIAMRKVTLSPESLLSKIDFNQIIHDIRLNMWNQLSPKYKAKFIIFEINEIYYSLGKNSLSATADLTEQEYNEKAVPLLNLALKKAHQGLDNLGYSQIASKTEVDLLFWVFRINHELRNIDTGDNYAELAITKALQTYGPQHMEIAKLHLIQYAIYSSTDVKKSLKAMLLAYDIVDSALSDDDWERYYYLDILSQAQLNAGNVDDSHSLMMKLFQNILTQGINGITKRGFDGLSASVFRFIDLNQLNKIPLDIQELYSTIINVYDKIWPGWLTDIDKQMLFLVNSVLIKKDSDLINLEADKALGRLIGKPQQNEDVSLYYDSLVCLDLIRVYDYLGLTNRVAQVYDIYKNLPKESDSYIINTIIEIQSYLSIFPIMKKHNLAKDDIAEFKISTMLFLNKNNLMTSYYKEKLDFL